MRFGLRMAMVLAVAFGIGVMPSGAVLSAEKSNPKSVPVRKVMPVSQKTKKVATGKNAQKVAAVRKQPVSRAASAKNAVALGEAQHLAVRSGAALVVDQQGGGALYQKNADSVVPIASITKLMTAMVVLDGTPDLKGGVTISDEDVDYLRGSRSRLHVGTIMPRETALLLALMSSENRAAHALARHYPGGLAAFVAAMNTKARSLGMLNTRFEDPTGLTSNNVSTANDLAKMVAAAHRYPLIRELSTTPEATVEVAGRPMEFRNTNPLVKNAAWDVGLSKTGYIHEAGKCLVMQARVADKPVVIVLLDSAGKLTRVGDANRIKRWMESTHAAAGLPTHAAAEVADGHG